MADSTGKIFVLTYTINTDPLKQGMEKATGIVDKSTQAMVKSTTAVATGLASIGTTAAKQAAALAPLTAALEAMAKARAAANDAGAAAVTGAVAAKQADGKDAAKPATETETAAKTAEKSLSELSIKGAQDELGKLKKSVEDNFKESFVNIFKGGTDAGKKFVSTLGSTLKSGLGNVLYELFAHQYLLKIGATLSGLVTGAISSLASAAGIPLDAGTGGNVAETLSTISSAYNAITGELSNAATKVAGFFGLGNSTALGSGLTAVASTGGSAGSSLISAADGIGLKANGAVLSDISGYSTVGTYASPGVTASASQIAPGLETASSGLSGMAYGGIAMAGSIGAGLLYGNKGYSSMGGGGGAMAGAYIGSIVPVIGTAVGAIAGTILGGALGSLFGDDDGPDTKITLGSNLGSYGKDMIAGDWTRKSALGTVGLTNNYWSSYAAFPDTTKAFLDTVQGMDNSLAASLTDTEKQTVKAALTNHEQVIPTGWEHSDPTQAYAAAAVERAKTILESVDKGLSKYIDTSSGTVADVLNQINGLLAVRKKLATDGDKTDFGSSVTLEQVDAAKVSGEAINVTFNRLVSTFSLTDEAAALVGKNVKDMFGAIGFASEKTRTAVVDAVGGVDAYASALSSYTQNYYSDAERAKLAADAVSKQMTAMGFGSVTTKAQFRTLVESLDLTTESGRTTYATLLSISAGFSSVVSSIGSTDSKLIAARLTFNDLAADAAKWLNLRTKSRELLTGIDSAMGVDDSNARQAELWRLLGSTSDMSQQLDLAGELKDLILQKYQTEKENAQTLIDFAKSLKAYVDSLDIGQLSPLTNGQKLAAAAQQYQQTLSAAAGGDATARGNVTGAADAYLTLAQAYYASSDQYAQIFDSVSESLLSLGTLSDAQGEAQETAGAQLAELTKLRAVAADLYQKSDSQYQNSIVSLGVAGNALDKLYAANGLLTEQRDLLKSLPAEIAGALGPALAGSNLSQLTSIYQNELGRAPDDGGLNYWAGKAAGGESYNQIAAEISSSNEAQVRGLYQTLLGRTADAGGLAYWLTDMSNGYTIDDIRRGIMSSPEFLDGSHADGLAYVPRDGYRAKLHKGERVLTAVENRVYSMPDLSRYADSGNDALVAEIKALRAENAEWRAEARQTGEQIVAVGAAQIDATLSSADTMAGSLGTAVRSNNLAAKALI